MYTRKKTSFLFSPALQVSVARQLLKLSDTHSDDTHESVMITPPPPKKNCIQFLSLNFLPADTVSYRDRNQGSILIQYIVQVFNTFAHQDDVEELFRKVSAASVNCFILLGSKSHYFTTMLILLVTFMWTVTLKQYLNYTSIITGK